MAGLEVMFSSVAPQLKGREDAIVCCLHWTVVSEGLKCIGVGETPPDNLGSCKKSELLPGGWNSLQDVYTLLYIQADTKQVYMLKVIKMDGNLLIHFMRLGENAADMTIDTSRYTSGDNSSYDRAYKNIDELQEKFRREVLDPSSKSAEAPPSRLLEGSYTSEQSRSTNHPGRPARHEDPLRIPSLNPRGGRHPDWAEPDDPFSIGTGDLDPLRAGIGGGMMFDPMRFHRPHRGTDPSAGLPGRLPPGAVPPGARFDPFGPDLDGSGNPRGGRAGPDPDHLPPPGYGNMFM